MKMSDIHIDIKGQTVNNIEMNPTKNKLLICFYR